MSRSVRKTKIRGITTATSEKRDKQYANRKFLRVTKQTKQITKRDDSENYPRVREISNVGSFDKDGKIYDEKMDVRK